MSGNTSQWAHQRRWPAETRLSHDIDHFKPPTLANDAAQGLSGIVRRRNWLSLYRQRGKLPALQVHAGFMRLLIFRSECFFSANAIDKWAVGERQGVLRIAISWLGPPKYVLKAFRAGDRTDWLLLGRWHRPLPGRFGFSFAEPKNRPRRQASFRHFVYRIAGANVKPMSLNIT